MGRRNIVFTGWQHRPHLVVMPVVGMSLEDRMKRIEGVVRMEIKDPDLVGMDCRKEAGRKLEMSLLEICPGFVFSADGILEEGRALGYGVATLAHLVELAATHRQALEPYRRVYAFSGGVLDDPRHGSVSLIPFIGRDGRHEGDLCLGVRSVRSKDQLLRGGDPDGREAFILYEPAGPHADLGCQGCSKSS